MKLIARVVTVGIFGLLNTLPAFGTDGTWTNLTTGVWSDPAQWVDGIVGGGSGSRIDIVPGFGGDRPDDRFLEVPYGDGVTLGSLRYLSGTPQGAIRIYGGPLVFDNPDGYANIQGNNGSLILLSEIHGTDTIQFDSVTLAAPAFHTGDTVVNGGINLYGHTYAATPGEAVTNFLPATRLTLMGNAHLSSLSRGSWGTFSADFSLTEGSRLAVCADVLNRGMGAMIEGEGIAPGTWLKASITEYVFELSQPATATGTFTLNIGTASPASLSLQQLRELAITERGTLEIKNWGALNRWEVDELTGAGTLVKRGDGTLALGIGDRFSGSLEVQGTAEIRGKGLEELELENLTVASGTRARPQPDMTVSANHFVADGSVVKTGAGTLVAATLGAAAKMEVREGHIDLGGGADLRTTCPVGGAWFHVDASRADTLTIESENGIDYVTRWEDADGGAVFATAGTRPFVNTNALNGLPVIDFGSYHYPNVGIQGYGGSLSWSETCWSVRELFIVYSDTEEIAELPGTIAGGFILGGDQYSFHRGLNSSLFISPYAAAQIREGLIEVDGEPRTFDYALPSGFHLIHLRTTGPVSAGAFARDRGLSFGGQRIAEAIVYNYTLPDSAATSIVNYLTGK